MEIKTLRKEMTTRSHLTHCRITDSSRTMKRPWLQALPCLSPQPQPLTAAVDGPVAFFPSYFHVAPIRRELPPSVPVL